MNPWFRFYEAALDDPKVQLLSADLFRFWVNCLCLACRNDGYLPPIESVSFAFRMSLEAATGSMKILRDSGLIDERRGLLSPHNWHKRQYKSDVSTDRVKRFRKRALEVSVTQEETPPDTDTEQSRNRAETEQIEKGIPRKRVHGKTPAPIDLVISPDLRAFAESLGVVDVDGETEAMLDHFRAKGESRLDWLATWRNWMRNTRKFSGGKGGIHKSKDDINRENANRLRARIDSQGGGGEFGGAF